MGELKRKGSFLESNVATLFRRAGFDVELNSRIKGYEIDVLVNKKPYKYIIECKQYETSPLSVRNILHQWDSKNKIICANRVIVVITGQRLTQRDYELAEELDMILLSDDELNDLNRLPNDRLLHRLNKLLKFDNKAYQKDLENEIRKKQKNKEEKIRKQREIKRNIIKTKSIISLISTVMISGTFFYFGRYINVGLLADVVISLVLSVSIFLTIFFSSKLNSKITSIFKYTREENLSNDENGEEWIDMNEAYIELYVRREMEKIPIVKRVLLSVEKPLEKKAKKNIENDDEDYIQFVKSYKKVMQE